MRVGRCRSDLGGTVGVPGAVFVCVFTQSRDRSSEQKGTTTKATHPKSSPSDGESGSPFKQAFKLNLVAAILSFVMLLATAWAGEFTRFSFPWWACFWLDLGHENNAAAWWSGSIFFLGFVLALDRALLDHARRKLFTSGWMWISCLALLLSFDEVGSLHARLPSRWLLFAPLGLSAAFGLLGLVVRRTERTRALWGVLAMSALAGAAVIDLAQDRGWQANSGLNLPVALEEGLELLAGFVLLKAAWTSAGRDDHEPVLVVADRGVFVALVVGVVFAGPMAYWTGTRLDQFRGHPADWLASALANVAALVAIHPWIARGMPIPARAWTQASLAALIGLCAVIPFHFPAMDVGEKVLNLRPLVFGAVMLLLACTLHARRAQVLTAASALAITFAFGPRPQWISVYWMGQLAALAGLAGVLVGRREMEEARAFRNGPSPIDT